MASNMYIHPENQKLLWTTIQNVPYIANLPTNFKHDWFKNIIKMFYEKNEIVRDRQTLQKINEQTIHYMIQSAKHIQQQQNQQQQNQQQQNQQQPQNSRQSPNIATSMTPEFTRYDSDTKKNTEWYNKAFMERQKEYEVMHAKPLAPDIDFSIKIEDSPINNVNELVEKYKKEREVDMNPYPSPPKTTIDNQSPVKKNISPVNTHPIRPPLQPTPRLEVIREDDITTELESESITLTYNTQENDISTSQLKQEIQELRNEINEMKKIIQYMQSESKNNSGFNLVSIKEENKDDLALHTIIHDASS
jgi:hypothetical protein